jgi:hypothetical protein
VSYIYNVHNLFQNEWQKAFKSSSCKEYEILHNYGNSLTSDNNMGKFNEDIQSLLVTSAAYNCIRTDIIRNVNNLADYNKAAVNGIFKSLSHRCCL